MSRRNKRISHIAEYLSIRILVGVAAIIPRSVMLYLGGTLGNLLRYLGVCRHVVDANMAHVGLWNKQEQEEIKKKLYRNVGRYFADYLRPSTRIPPYLINDSEYVNDVVASRKGVVALLGHYGNWEILGTIFGRSIDNLSVIAKPMRNKLVQEWLDRKRSSTGVTTIYVNRALRKSFGLLKTGGMLGVLIDQYAAGDGVPVPFLGKETNTLQAVGFLAHKTGCIVMPAYAVLRDDSTYDVIVQRIEPPDTEGLSDEEAILEHLKQHNEVLSSWIREHPEHWFGWFHKRYRGQVKYLRRREQG